MKTRLSRSPRINRGTQAGFLLPAVALLSAAILAVVLALAQRVEQQLSDVQALLRASEASIDQSSAGARVTFMLLSAQTSAFGFGLDPLRSVRVDDRPYKIGNSSLVSLQDTAGLVNINRADLPMLRRLADYVGVAPEQQDVLADRILDFIDNDRLERLNGAETADYAAQGLPGPLDDTLMVASQIRGVLGWTTLLTPDQASQFESALVAEGMGSINPNAAPAAVLSAALAIPRPAAEIIVARRMEGFIADTTEISRLSPLPQGLLALALNPVPSATVRMTLVDSETGFGQRSQITLTPYSETAPWKVDYASIHSAPNARELARSAATFPDPGSFSSTDGARSLGSF
jgi:hypothetical protein